MTGRRAVSLLLASCSAATCLELFAGSAPQLSGRFPPAPPVQTETVATEASGTAATVPVEPLPGWPVVLESATSASATVDFLDADGTRAALIPDGNIFGTEIGGKVHALAPRGDELPGWPSFVGGFGFASASLVDIDGDGRLETFVGGKTEYFGLTHDGQVLPGWPVSATANPEFSEVQAPCAIGDLNGDGTFEIVGANLDGEVSVWGQGGSLRPGWPVQLPSVLRDGRQTIPPGVSRSPSLGDLDGDGKLEILVGSRTGLLHVFRHDGTDFPGFPFDFNLFNMGKILSSTPALADVDSDGLLEIIMGSRGNRPGEAQRRLFVIRADGTLQPGYPVLVSDQIPEGVVVADLDGDGQLWLIASINTGPPAGDFSPKTVLMVWNARTGEPRPGFPVSGDIAALVGSPAAVGDITGDGFPDILLPVFPGFCCGRDARLFAWDRFGVRIFPFPLETFAPDNIVSGSAATVTDLNDDVLIDVLVPAFPFDFSGLAPGRLHTLTLNRLFDARTLEWPAESHDVRHTGLYEPPVDELRLSGRLWPRFVFLNRPRHLLTASLRVGDQRRDLAAKLADRGVQIVAINDRSISPLPGRILARPGMRHGSWRAAARWPDLIVRFDSKALAAAVLERLRKAGVPGGEKRGVRLKLESPLQDRRRVGGEVRLQVLMPPGG